MLQQPDGYNCVFIIMFMEMILAASALFITQPMKKQLVDWFVLSVVSGQCSRRAGTLCQLSTQQNPQQTWRAPAIQFEPPSQLQGLGCFVNLTQCCFAVSALLLLVRCELDTNLDHTSPLSTAQQALANILVGITRHRRNPANPPMSPGPFIMAVNGLRLKQFKYKQQMECAVELVETVVRNLTLAEGYLVSHQEVGTCSRCAVRNQQVSRLSQIV